MCNAGRSAAEANKSFSFLPNLTTELHRILASTRHMCDSVTTVGEARILELFLLIYSTTNRPLIKIEHHNYATSSHACATVCSSSAACSSPSSPPPSQTPQWSSLKAMLCRRPTQHPVQPREPLPQRFLAHFSLSEPSSLSIISYMTLFLDGFDEQENSA